MISRLKYNRLVMHGKSCVLRKIVDPKNTEHPYIASCCGLWGTYHFVIYAAIKRA